MQIRIATFNVENLDDKPGDSPTLTERIPVLRPQFERMRANIVCLQEVHGQETPGQPRDLLALKQVIQGTIYQNYHIAHTTTSAGEAYDVRNLVVLSEFPIVETQQIRSDLISDIMYQKLTAHPPETQAKVVKFQRPLLYTKIQVAPGFLLHLVNLHLKSRRPSNVAGQLDGYAWKSASGWAEGYFLSSMKRVGQALETRVLVDSILDNETDAKVVICGDFNAHPEEVPVEAITGRIENTGNADLVTRVLTPVEMTIPEPSRYTYIHQGDKRLLDHMLISRSMLSYYHTAEIHNETLHDEGIAFAFDTKFPEPDHAPFIAAFNLPDCCGIIQV